MRQARWHLLGLSMLAGCVLGACGAAKEKPRPVAPAAPPSDVLRERAEGEVRVVLLWSAPVDLDVFVTDPRQETVYFGNSRSGSGGKLTRDARCPKDPGPAEVRMESVSFRKASPGHYRVGVDFPNPCGTDFEEVECRIVAEVRGQRFEGIAKVKPKDFRYQALEFDVPER
ncbi:MAG: hypothetical protein QOD06_905 [Candidatus Binatota bacterium]|nr:hypothetical protein [Candidatus Binatota bacterium]